MENDIKMRRLLGSGPSGLEQSDEGNACSENSQNDGRRRTSVIKLGAIVVFLAIMLVFMTIAWFTMNRETSANGMPGTTGSLPFEIGTRGAKIRYQEIIEEKTGYRDGDPAAIDGKDYYKTGTKGSILLRFDTGESEIAPGGNGSLELYVIPNVDTSFNVKVTLNVTAYAQIDKFEETEDQETGKTIYLPAYRKDENGDPVLDDDGNKIVDTELVEITTASKFIENARAVHNDEAADNADDYINAANYLKGHIMFFGGEGDTKNSTAETDRFYYTTPYTTREIKKHIEAGNKDKAVPVPIYWMWPNTLGQIALPDNISGERSGYPILKDDNAAGKALIKTYLDTNGDIVFDNYDEDVTPGHIAAVTASVTNADDFDTTAFNALSKGYNNADHLIGTKIAYFLIEVVVDQTD